MEAIIIIVVVFALLINNISMINIVVVSHRSTGHLLLGPLYPPLIFSSLSCALGDCPLWAVSLALRLPVGSGKWEILEVVGPEESEEKDVFPWFLLC